jgi:hypothetical protein
MPVQLAGLWHFFFAEGSYKLKRLILSMKLSSAIGGLAGACALTIINQVVAKLDSKAPRLDLLGMNAVAKFVKSPKSAPFLVQKLLPMSVAGDLVSNSLYYAMAGSKSKQQTLIRGLLLGLGAGIGAVALPKQMGLDPSPTNLTTKTQGLTIAWYVLGGLVAAMTISAIEHADAEEGIPSKASKGKIEPVLAGL